MISYFLTLSLLFKIAAIVAFAFLLVLVYFLVKKCVPCCSTSKSDKDETADDQKTYVQEEHNPDLYGCYNCYYSNPDEETGRESSLSVTANVEVEDYRSNEILIDEACRLQREKREKMCKREVIFKKKVPIKKRGLILSDFM